MEVRNMLWSSASKIEGFFQRGNVMGSSELDRTAYTLDNFKRDLIIPPPNHNWAGGLVVGAGDVIQTTEGFLYRVVSGGSLGNQPPKPSYVTYEGVLRFVNGSATIEYVGASQFIGAWKLAEHGGMRWYFTNIAAGQLAADLPSETRTYLSMAIKNIVRDWAPEERFKQACKSAAAKPTG